MRRSSHSTWTRWNYSGYPDARRQCSKYQHALGQATVIAEDNPCSWEAGCMTVERGNSADCRQHFQLMTSKYRINRTIDPICKFCSYLSCSLSSFNIFPPGSSPFTIFALSLRLFRRYILSLYPLVSPLQSLLSQSGHFLLDLASFMRYSWLFLRLWPEVQLPSVVAQCARFLHHGRIGYRSRDGQSSTWLQLGT
jgi:hypothetical protein